MKYNIELINSTIKAKYMLMQNELELKELQGENLIEYIVDKDDEVVAVQTRVDGMYALYNIDTFLNLLEIFGKEVPKELIL